MEMSRAARRTTSSIILFVATSCISSTFVSAADLPLFVSNQGTQVIGSYDSVTGQANNAAFSVVVDPEGLAAVNGDLFVATYGHGVTGAGIIGEYSESTGLAINPTLVTGLTGTNGIVVSGNTIYASDYTDGTVSAYNATTGAAISSFSITGLSKAYHLALQGNNLLVADAGNGRVGEYDATTGEPENSSFIKGLTYPTGLAISGNTLYVVDPQAAVVGTYNATTGAAINSTFITAAGYSFELAIANGDLYVDDYGNSAIDEYDATSGSLIAPSFIYGLSQPTGIAVDVPNTPEPASVSLIAAGSFCLLGRRRRTAKHGR